ncbi:hypothetical protein LCY76_17495 [Fictibacillus sp. KIGAM418]|uniref:Uncharacterized protein n=1 Tax=Fictibacillus marinisediminis TaxID=2878389 RepID=A0A9X2BE78_9BACL|nr:hypothetical protein [Fictibacillus marinisediminis]MCK6258371.1 hypothetical protein [Fictibacillus marinisediminis]
MDWVHWQEQVQKTAFLQPLIGTETPSVTADGERLCFSFVNKYNGSERMTMLTGRMDDLHEVFGGQQRLSDLIRLKRVTFTGTYREQLKLESLLFLCKLES